MRHGLSFSFSSLLDDGASGRFLCFSLSQQFPIYAFLVDMGGGKQGGDSDNMTDRPWMGKTAERGGVTVCDQADHLSRRVWREMEYGRPKFLFMVVGCH